MIGGDGINDESNKMSPAPNTNFLLNTNKDSSSLLTRYQVGIR